MHTPVALVAGRVDSDRVAGALMDYPGTVVVPQRPSPRTGRAP